MRIALLLVVCLSLPNAAMAWWNNEWAKKMPITLTAPADKAPATADAPTETVVLVKLHSGNFPDFFSLKDNLADLRFIAADDKTPLKFHVDSFDLINQLLFVWVKVPPLAAGANTKIWMYYSNEKAVPAADEPGSYAVSQAAVYHFKAKPESTDDSTAYKNPATFSGGEMVGASLIGSGLKLNGASQLTIADIPSNKFDTTTGFSISAWIKPTALSTATNVFSRIDANQNGLDLVADATSVSVQLSRAGKAQRITANTALETNKWHHIAVVSDKKSILLYVNGELVKSDATPAFTASGILNVGGKSTLGSGFVGEIDEVQLTQASISHQAVQLMAKNQGMVDEIVAVAAPEEASSSEGDHSGLFMVMIKSTDTAGWVILGILFVMAVITWIVIIGKSIYLRSVSKDNKAFLKEYANLIETDPASLDQEDTPEDKELEDTPIRQAIFGSHDHYQSSPIYRLYHRGIFEIRGRSKTILESGLTNRSNNAIKATLDAQTIREAQRLNSKMILLTIAINGGPFIGLFGTVMGVAMTFAGIAQSGDVNIAAIAPGVAAALLATLGGLTVAIPSLFAFNYLSTQIKEHIADMRVFSDEFATRLAEYYGRS